MKKITDKEFDEYQILKKERDSKVEFDYIKNYLEQNIISFIPIELYGNHEKIMEDEIGRLFGKRIILKDI